MEAAADIDVLAVVADHDAARPLETGGAGHAALQHLHLLQVARAGIALEDADRVDGLGRGVDARPIVADGDEPGALQAGDTVQALLVRIRLGEDLRSRRGGDQEAQRASQYGPAQESILHVPSLRD